MKYAVIAALAATTVSAACPAVIKGGEYTDAECKTPKEGGQWKEPTEAEIAKFDGTCHDDGTNG